MAYVITKKMHDFDLINIMQMGAETFYELVRAEILDRMNKKETTPPAKRQGRPPKNKSSEAGIQPTGEFVRTRSVQKRHVALEDSDKPGTRKKEKKKSRRFSAATRKKMAESQRKRWAKAAKKKKK